MDLKKGPGQEHKIFLQPYLLIYFGISPYQEYKFLSLIQAIEIYHRISSSTGKYEEYHINQEEFKKTKNQLKLSIKSILKNKNPLLLENMLRSIGFSNTYTLRERLINLICHLEIETQALLCLNSKSFAKRVVDTRNFLTHRESHENMDIIPAGITLAIVIEQLTLLIHVLIFKELNFDEVQIRTLLESSSTLQSVNFMKKKYSLEEAQSS